MKEIMKLFPQIPTYQGTYKDLIPRTSLRDAFNKWLNKCRDKQFEEINKNFRSKVLRSSVKRAADRMDRDALIKAFFKWKNLARNPDDYYPKMNKGFDLLKSALLKRTCKEPYELIKDTKNMGRHIDKVLRSKARRDKQINQDDLKKYFVFKLKI